MLARRGGELSLLLLIHTSPCTLSLMTIARSLIAALVLFAGCRTPQDTWTTEAAQERFDRGDREGARQLLEAAPDSSTQAKILLASLLLREDPARAQRLLDSAAQQGSTHALYLSGYWWLRGGGDSSAAFSRIRQAARAGSPAAQGYLWTVYRDGRHGVAAQPDSALLWLHRAVASGDSFAVRDARALPDSLRSRFSALGQHW